MQLRQTSRACRVVAAIAAMSAVTTATAQVTYDMGTNGAPNGGQFTIAGATLFADFFNQQGITVDFINVNGDTIPCSGLPRAGFFDSNCDSIPDSVQQLAGTTANEPLGVPAFGCPTWQGYWAFQYRSVGSFEGFGEFVTYQLTGETPTAIPSERGLLNRVPWASGGNQLPMNVGGCTLASVADCNTDGTISTLDPGTPLCYDTIDGGSTDVPSAWGVRDESGPAIWSAKPITGGYGDNTNTSTSGYNNRLDSLARPPFGTLNFNYANPDANTIYDTVVAWSPVTYIANPGTGLENLTYTEGQHLWVTGRSKCGENLVVGTRDIGSGTRNVAHNALGIDPSWGVGDNVGDRFNNDVATNSITPTTKIAQLGPNSQQTNCGGSGIVEVVVQNWRLAIGHTGLAGSSRAVGDHNAGRYEVMNLCKDIDGDRDGVVDSDCTPSVCDNGTFGTGGGGCSPFTPASIPDENTRSNNGYVRPYVSNVLDNDDPRCGYQAGGFQTISSRGDPESGRNGNTNPPIANVQMQNFLRNITDSVAAFVGNPPASSNFFSPAEVLVTQFFLVNSVDAVTFNNDPTNIQPNPALSQISQDYARCNNGLGVGGDLAAFGDRTVAGFVPRRQPTGTPAGFAYTYSDGSTNGNYLANNSTTSYTISTSARLNHRNLISGDANYDGVRNVNDIPGLVSAFDDPRAFQSASYAGGAGEAVPGWARPLPSSPPGATYNGGLSANYAIPEILFDFNGDGDFDADDLRYFGDGLSINPDGKKPGALDRKEGFTQIDTELVALSLTPNVVWGLPATHSTGKAYAAGDVRADIAGSAVSKGAQPTGHNGLINAVDIDYVRANFGAWSNLDEAAVIDLSADMNGDLAVNEADVCEIIRSVLCTNYGDVNLDGSVTTADTDIISGISPVAAFPRAGNYADGDVDGDGDVDVDDLNIATANLGASAPCTLVVVPGDANNSGTTDVNDLPTFVDALLRNISIFSNEYFRSDMDGNCSVDGNDIQPFVDAIVP